jgi:hypothetical protein
MRNPSTSKTGHIVDCLNTMSIDQAKNAVQNVDSWEDARLYAVKRIKDLKFSLAVFNKMIQEGRPWLSSSDAKPSI